MKLISLDSSKVTIQFVGGRLWYPCVYIFTESGRYMIWIIRCLTKFGIENKSRKISVLKSWNCVTQTYDKWIFLLIVSNGNAIKGIRYMCYLKEYFSQQLVITNENHKRWYNCLFTIGYLLERIFYENSEFKS